LLDDPFFCVLVLVLLARLRRQDRRTERLLAALVRADIRLERLEEQRAAAAGGEAA